MSSRLHQVAVVNEEIAERGTYRGPGGAQVEVAERLAAARAGTLSYTPEQLTALLESAPSAATAGARLEVTAEGSMQAAERLHQEGGRRIGVLNFASARNPGGGYLRGARAQEEDVCRTALLYSCLLAAPDYYAAHRASDDLRYSHRVIFSPGVPVIRDGRGELAAQPYEVDFLTSPAPNAGQLRRRSESVDVREVLAERALRVLAVAARHGVRELVLGAWGCGVFANDPGEVAAAFESALVRYGTAFDRVVFAVWDRTAVSPNRAAFEARFGS
ncbi:TIGR02452 family protein [Kitasatospora mediocidica]|uniref:TIGR02452 family protein n=1 Tax=Kitasatospora mediocidica TaxID=58352 RepID=UPI000566E0FD|nr:TIGR02452 family protein [Kitasatospora mediocidica]